MGRPKKPVVMCGICGAVRLISKASLTAGACSKCRGKESAIVRTQAYRKRHPDRYRESNIKACKKWRLTKVSEAEKEAMIVLITGKRLDYDKV